MNFGLMISCNVETKLAAVERSDDWTQADEALEYERCLREVVEEHGRAWADGNIRMGDYILIVSLARVGPFFPPKIQTTSMWLEGCHDGQVYTLTNLVVRSIPTLAYPPIVSSMPSVKWRLHQM